MCVCVGVCAFFFLKLSQTPLAHSVEANETKDEGCRIYLRPEEQGRRRDRPVRPEPGHLQVQDPAAGRADERLPAGHEQLLQQAEGARAHAAHQQEGDQGGDPAARHRLHLGPAGRAGRAGEEPPAALRPPHAADHAERGAGQHLGGERLLRREDNVPLRADGASSHINPSKAVRRGGGPTRRTRCDILGKRRNLAPRTV